MLVPSIATLPLRPNDLRKTVSAEASGQLIPNHIKDKTDEDHQGYRAGEEISEDDGEFDPLDEVINE